MTKYNKIKHYWSLKNQAKLDSLIKEKGKFGCYCYLIGIFYNLGYDEFSEKEKYLVREGINKLIN